MKVTAILVFCIAIFSASLASTITFSEYDEISAKPKFDFDKNYGNGNDTFTKMTARFHYGYRYGENDSFFATYWSPGEHPAIHPEQINALIFVSHGYAEYLSNDYDEIARHWSQEVGGGALVFGHDHAGHGRTTAGKRALVTDIKDFTGPIIAHVKEIQKMTMRDGKNIPVYIAAHSMGGLIALHTILEQPELFEGFIGIGPLVKLLPKDTTPVMLSLAEFMGKFWPSFGHPIISGIDVTLITRDQTLWDSMDNDPLRFHGGTKMGMGWLMVRETMVLQENLNKIALPILVLQGGSDPILDPQGARMLYNESSAIDKEYKEYPAAYHQLLVEYPDVREDVKARTTTWLNNRLTI